MQEIDTYKYLNQELGQSVFTIWLPIPPQGCVALGCIVLTGREKPLSSSTFCVSTTLVTPCQLSDCIVLNSPPL